MNGPQHKNTLYYEMLCVSGRPSQYSSRKREKKIPNNVYEIEWLVRTTISILINDWNCFMLLPIFWYNEKRTRDLRVMHGFDLLFFFFIRFRSCFWIKCFTHLMFGLLIDTHVKRPFGKSNEDLGRCMAMVNKTRKWQKEKKKQFFFVQNLYM